MTGLQPIGLAFRRESTCTLNKRYAAARDLGMILLQSTWFHLSGIPESHLMFIEFTSLIRFYVHV